MIRIDLNADLGENAPDRVVSDDRSMLDIVTSANISCGFHAGSPEGIRRTLADAIERGVAIGAHPSYRDYEGFGRRALDVGRAELQADLEYQLGGLIALASSAGGRVTYVKPHGALYNTIAHDEASARTMVAAVRAIDPSLMFLGLAGSLALDVAERGGLSTVAEAFADRAYLPTGELVPRSAQGSVLHDSEAVAKRMLRLAREGRIESAAGTDVLIRADSICVHGDSVGAVEIATATRELLEAQGVEIVAFTRVMH